MLLSHPHLSPSLITPLFDLVTTWLTGCLLLSFPPFSQHRYRKHGAVQVLVALVAGTKDDAVVSEAFLACVAMLLGSDPEVTHGQEHTVA